MVFGNLGLLKNKKATCYPGFEDELHGAIITGNAVEQTENIITGKGAGIARITSYNVCYTKLLRTEIKNVIVPGAVYTCYQLYKIVNGPIAQFISQNTSKIMTVITSYSIHYTKLYEHPT